MKRYHPLLVSLHWLLAVLILFSLFAGSNILADMPNDNPDKIAILKVHIISGLVILVLMLLRLFVELKRANLWQLTLVMFSSIRQVNIAIF